MNWLSTSLTTCPERREIRWWFVRVVLLITALCSVSSGQELNLNRTISQYARERWGEKQGFPGDEVTAFAQTADGYLWIGTKKGLIRFDGLEFKVYAQAVPENVQIGAVRALTTDSRGNLWILLEGSQVLRFHNGRFESGREGAELGVSAIGARKDGTTLFASLTGLGTIAFDGQKFEVLAPQANNLPTRDAMVAVQGDDDLFARFNWAVGVAEGRVAGSAVVALAETSDGKIWRATADHGYSYLFNGHIFQVERGTIGGRTTCLLPLNDGEMWIGTDKGVLRWDGTKLTQLGIPAALRRADVHALLRGRDSNIWIGTTNGLFRVNKGGLSHDADSGTIEALFEDREGNIWAGKSGSIERLRESLFVTYPVAADRSDSSGPIYIDEDGRAWFAPLEGSLHWLKGTETGAITYDSLANDVVYSIAGQKHELWIGRQRGGLTRLLVTPDTVSSRTYTENDGLAQNTVYAVYESQDGTVWSGTLSRGVSKLKDGHFTNYTTSDGLASNTISAIAEGTDGRMWFGTPKGLSELSKDGWRNHAVPGGLSNEIDCLLRDSGGVLWIGTAGGLAFFRDGQVQVPQGTQAWLREPILGMADDQNGWLWVATSTRVLRAKRDSLMSGQSLKDSDLRVYGRDEGLGGTEGVKRFRSVVKDSQGNVWFSTSHGLSVVNPNQGTVNSLSALLRVKGVVVDGSEVNLGQAIRVPPGKQRIVFHYLGLSLAKPERVRYRYWLDGFDHGWIDGGTNQEATYSNLGAGSYRFRVMASNSDGLWNGSEATVGFEVEPTLWQTWWFRLSCVVCAGLATLVVYRLRVRQVTQLLKVGFEERLSERTRIARELHDTLLQSFQGVLMKLHIGVDMIRNRPEEAEKILARAIEQARQAVTEGRDAVQGLRSSTTEMNDLSRAIRVLAAELADQSDSSSPEFQMNVEGTPRDLPPIVRDDVYRIAGEALRNAFRHAQAARIEVEIGYYQRQLRLRIRDDGKGIDPKILESGARDGHYGLPGLQERAKRVGGKLTVWSEPGFGTEIELTIPGSVVYASTGGSHIRRRSAS